MGLNIVNSWRVWRNLRKKLSPTFTSGKLKRMLEPMENVADKFVRHLETCAREGVEVDMKAAMKGVFFSARPVLLTWGEATGQWIIK